MSPPRGSLRAVICDHLAPSPGSGVNCENASPGRTGAAASAAAAKAVGGLRGARWWRRAERCFFPFSLQSGGFVNRSQKSVSVGRAHFFCCPGALRAAWCLRGKSGGSGAGHRGVGEFIAAKPARARRGRAGSGTRGLGEALRPARRRREVEAAEGARREHGAVAGARGCGVSRSGGRGEVATAT